jgi:membrane protein
VRGRRAPDSPTQLAARSWWGVLKRTISEFRSDNLSDWAAALTYYSVLALFPMLIVLVALLGLVGQEHTVDTLISSLQNAGLDSLANGVKQPLREVVSHKAGAGAFLGFALAGSLWSASGYIGAFTRAANAIYDVEEGRPFWKRRPLQVLMTLGVVLLLALVSVALVLTGSLAVAVGDAIGVGRDAVRVWSIAKWPVLLVVVGTMFALLYYVAPNVRQPRFRWITPGGVLAVLLWVAASAGFGVYIAHLGSYDRTYGALAGVIVFLVWMWITNVAILLGAEFDAELLRERERMPGVGFEPTRP